MVFSLGKSILGIFLTLAWVGGSLLAAEAGNTGLLEGDLASLNSEEEELPSLRVVFFYSPGCPGCDKVESA